MNKAKRLALIAALVTKSTGASMSAVMQPTRHDIREEVSLVNVSDRGELPHDFDTMPASRELIGAFDS